MGAHGSSGYAPVALVNSETKDMAFENDAPKKYDRIGRLDT
jgi:hypothetical protein